MPTDTETEQEGFAAPSMDQEPDPSLESMSLPGARKDWGSVVARRQYVEAQMGDAVGAVKSTSKWGAGVERLVRHQAEQSVIDPRTPDVERIDAASFLAKSHGAEAAQAQESARQRAKSASQAGNASSLTERIHELHQQFGGEDLPRVSAQLKAEGWDRSLITPKVLSTIDDEIRKNARDAEMLATAEDPAVAQIAGQRAQKILGWGAIRRQLLAMRDEGYEFSNQDFDRLSAQNPTDARVRQIVQAAASPKQFTGQDFAAAGIRLDQKAPFGVSGAAPAAKGADPNVGGGKRGFIDEMLAAVQRSVVDTPAQMAKAVGTLAVGPETAGKIAGELPGQEAVRGKLAPTNPESWANTIGSLPVAVAGAVPGAAVSGFNAGVERTGGNIAAGVGSAAVAGAAALIPFNVATKGTAPLAARAGEAAVLGGVSSVGAEYANEAIARAGGADPAEVRPGRAFAEGALFGLGVTGAHAAGSSLVGRLYAAKATAEMVAPIVPSDAPVGTVVKALHDKLIQDGVAPAEARAVSSQAGVVYDTASKAALKPEVREALAASTNPDQARQVLTEIAAVESMRESPTKATTLPPEGEAVSKPSAEVEPPVEAQAQKSGQEPVGVADAQGGESVPAAEAAPVSPAEAAPIADRVGQMFMEWTKQNDPEAVKRIEQAKTAEVPPPDATPAEPAKGEEAVSNPLLTGEAEPKTIGLNIAEQDRIRAETALEALDPAERRGWQKVMDQAIVEEVPNDAIRIAKALKEHPRPITDTEHAGMVVKAAELANEYDATVADVARLIDEGKPEQAQAARAKAQSILDDIDALTEGTRHGRREVARALSIGRMMVEREDFKLAPVMQRAKEASGKPPSPEQTAKVEGLVSKLSEVQKLLSESEKKYETMRVERDQAIAAKVHQAEARRSEAGRKLAGAKDKIKAERADLRKQLLSLGYRANEVSGITAEAAYIVGKYAMTYVREGALELGEVVRKVREDFPDLSEADVYKAIASKDPKAQARARTETEKRVQQVRTQARLMDQLAKAEAGVFEAPKGKPAQPEQIKTLRKELSGLRKEAFRSDMEAHRLEKALHAIDELQGHLDNHTRALKKSPAEAGPELQKAREKAAHLRKLMDTTDTLSDLNRQLETGDFVVKEKPAPKEVPEDLDRLRIEVKKAKSEIRNAIDEMRPWTKARKVNEGLNFLRTIKATGDMSATLRQGFILAGGHPLLATKAFARSFKSYFSENTAHQIDHAIRSSPNQYLRDKAKLYLAPLDTFSPTLREEAFMSGVAKKIPGAGQIVKASDRHMASYLNLLRSSVFDAFVEANPNATTKEITQLADFIGVATGRGRHDLGPNSSAIASVVAFSPRFTLSRLQLLYSPLTNWTEPRVRKEYARNMVGAVVAGNILLQLAEWMGAEVTMNPFDPDFGKVKIGNQRFEIWGGMQPVARMIAEIGLFATDQAGITGQNLTKSQKKFDLDDRLGQFTKGKASPTVTLGYEMLTGTDWVTSRDKNRAAAAAGAFVPMLAEGVAEAWQDAGVGMGIAAGGISAIGGGTSNYPNSPAQEKRRAIWKRRFSEQKSP